jgi:hypothetical protein
VDVDEPRSDDEAGGVDPVRGRLVDAAWRIDRDDPAAMHRHVGDPTWSAGAVHDVPTLDQ